MPNHQLSAEVRVNAEQLLAGLVILRDANRAQAEAYRIMNLQSENTADYLTESIAKLEKLWDASREGGKGKG